VIKPLIPPPLKKNATWGIFSPSTPGAAIYENIYQQGVNQLREMGFQIKEGFLTASRANQGYRSGSPQDRAREFMELYLDPEVTALMAVLGGTSTSSLIPYLDYEAIRRQPKIVCGFSDVTALHLALLHHSNLATFYGPSVVRSLGRNYFLEETLKSFLETMVAPSAARTLKAPEEWIAAPLKAQAPVSHGQGGWEGINTGEAEGPLLAVNLNTLLRSAGTEIFPDLTGHILFIEEMNLPFAKFERNFRQLERMGVLNKTAGLVISKPEILDSQGAPFSFKDLILEILSDTLKTRANYPVIMNFDAGHTYPQITLRQRSACKIKVSLRDAPEITIL
jgi:muramoyltetrapeptide carboxypeptidase LdcA involved in peptidoglycan recycling